MSPTFNASPNQLTLALSKGRIFTETLPLLEAAGIRVTEDPETSRKLVIGTNRRDLRLGVVRASDTPTYVQHGGADHGEECQRQQEDRKQSHCQQDTSQYIDPQRAMREKFKHASFLGLDQDRHSCTNLV